MNMRVCRNYVVFGFLMLAGLCIASLACSNDSTSSTVTGVTVSPATASVAKGGTQQFTADPATVTWTIVETGKNSGTTINASGLLTVAAAETLSSFTVKATSTEDTAKSGTATVTVTSNALTGTVSVSGTPRIGRTITANTAGLGGTGTINYQWKRGNTATAAGSNIGTDSPGYELVNDDENKYIKVTVTRDGYSDSITSNTIGPVLPPGAILYTSNSGGNKPLTGSPYGYEMWTEGGNNNKLIWYGPTERGGAAFRAEWNNPNDFLGRIGYFWGSGGLYTTYKNMYADFTYTRSGRSTAGDYSYIGIYGWARNPGAAEDKEKLIEYYIVEDWFGNQWQNDTSPMGTSTTQGSVVGSYTLDGATYSVIKNVRNNQPSIEGPKTFTQYFSIRQTLRKTGTISITKHFDQWDTLGMKLGNMYECKFLVEAGGGTGWLEFTYLKFSQEDSPRVP